MKYWLVNESAPRYNLGLEKARNWLEGQGHDVVLAPFSMEAKFVDAVWFSAIFSWHLPSLFDHASLAHAWGKEVEIGGPAAGYNALLIKEMTGVTAHVGLDARFEDAPGRYRSTFTSRGCRRRCPWCVVPVSEGRLTEKADFIPASLVHDNNFTATSAEHQVRSVERLIASAPVNFDQAWDARIFDEWHLTLYRRMRPKVWRFAFDHMGVEKDVERVCKLLARHKLLNRRDTLFYILVGFGEGKEKDTYRTELVRDLGAYPFVMSYVPLDSLTKEPPALGWPSVQEMKEYSYYYDQPMIWTAGERDEYVPSLGHALAQVNPAQSKLWSK